jgi:hypothetical protein
MSTLLFSTRMNNPIIIIIIFVLSSIGGYGQNMNSVWVFGDSSGIDFSNVNSPFPITSVMDGRGSCTSISDSSSNLLIYAYTQAHGSSWSTFVFNGNNDSIAGADSITGEAWYNELVIVPKPESTNEYYLLSIGEDAPNNGGLYSTLIDINLNGGAGQVVYQNVQLNNQNQSDCLNAVKHGNGRDWWVIGKYSSQATTSYNRFFVYLITTDTIQAPLIQDEGGMTDGDLQKIIFHPNGNKLMLIDRAGFMCQYDFDRCTGILSNPLLIFAQQTGNYNNRLFWEGAYSPNGSLFYVTTVNYYLIDTNYILQYDLAAPDIPASEVVLDSFVHPVGSGAVRLAPDGKIYFSRAYECSAFPDCYPYPDSARNYVNENLSVINQPNNFGAACDYQPFSFYLGGKRTYYGLPNNPNYSLGPDTGSICDSLPYLGIGILHLTGEEANFNIYPNPFTDQITFDPLKPSGENILLTVFNPLGEIVYRSQIKFLKQVLDLPDLASGVYSVVVNINENILTKKIIRM